MANLGKRWQRPKGFLSPSGGDLKSRAILGVVSAVIGQQTIARGVLEELKRYCGTN
jgi:hypothetical protein